jgi:hypothetical protein
METILFISGMILGGLISWEISHLYYEKSSKDQAALLNKLSEEVRHAIIADNRKKLTILELKELIEQEKASKNA